MAVTDLAQAIMAVCPIDGVSIGNPADKATWRIDYSTSATPAQKTAAQNLVASYVFDGPDPLTAADYVSLQIAFNHENRIRALEGKQAITVAQFRNAVKALLT